MAENAFLKIKSPEIKGESQDENGHKEEIELNSYQMGANLNVSVSGSGIAGAGKPSVSELVVTKTVDSSTPKLWAALMAGTHFGEVILSISKQGNKEKPFDFYKVTLGDVMLSSIGKSGSGNDPVIHESLSFAFANMATEYFAQNPDGSSKKVGNMSYDLKKNAK
jgi:type VI secretion system secreted protein Hcp